MHCRCNLHALLLQPECTVVAMARHNATHLRSTQLTCTDRPTRTDRESWCCYPKNTCPGLCTPAGFAHTCPVQLVKETHWTSRRWECWYKLIPAVPRGASRKPRRHAMQCSLRAIMAVSHDRCRRTQAVAVRLMAACITIDRSRQWPPVPGSELSLNLKFEAKFRTRAPGRGNLRGEVRARPGGRGAACPRGAGGST